MYVPGDADYLQISKTFFKLQKIHREEIDNLINIIKTNLSGIASNSPWADRLVPNPNYFDLSMWALNDLFDAANSDIELTGRVVYLRWYYGLILLAMAGIAAKKIIDCITKAGDRAKVAVIGANNFSYILDVDIKINIHKKNDSWTPWDEQYYSFIISYPSWKKMLNYCMHDDWDKYVTMKYDMPCNFKIDRWAGLATERATNIPISELGKYIKEHLIDKIKQIIANK